MSLGDESFPATRLDWHTRQAGGARGGARKEDCTDHPRVVTDRQARAKAGRTTRARVRRVAGRVTTRCSCTPANTTWTTPRRIWGPRRAPPQASRGHVNDAAVPTKNEKGEVKIVDKTEKPTQHGGWAGLAAGAAIGLIFPPLNPGKRGDRSRGWRPH